MCLISAFEATCRFVIYAERSLCPFRYRNIISVCNAILWFLLTCESCPPCCIMNGSCVNLPSCSSYLSLLPLKGVWKRHKNKMCKSRHLGNNFAAQTRRCVVLLIERRTVYSGAVGNPIVAAESTLASTARPNQLCS